MSSTLVLSTRVQVTPPSAERNTPAPLSVPLALQVPAPPARITLLSVGCTATALTIDSGIVFAPLPLRADQVAPASVLTQTVLTLFGSSVTAPTGKVPAWSKIGVQLAPALVVFQTPPAALPM